MHPKKQESKGAVISASIYYGDAYFWEDLSIEK